MEQRSPALRLKRAADVCLAGGGLVAMAPLLGGLSAIDVAVHGWPPFFVQARPGIHGRPFSMVKLRTMSNERGSDGALRSDAERLTRFGRLLRATSLDELPELLNVLVGDMSLVGPRPLLMQYLERYSEEQMRRHDMPPGITGLAQVRGRNALTWEQKFAMDLDYVDSWSLGRDIRILFDTFRAVLVREGISAPGEATMPLFEGDGGRRFERRAPLRIAATIATLGGGGAERVMTTLANGWSRRGDAVTLVTLDDAPPFYPLDPSVARVGLGLMGGGGGPIAKAGRIAARLRGLRRAIEAAAPDVVVSFVDRLNVLTLLAAERLRVPVVVSERVHPGFVDPPGWGLARRLAYTRADAVVAQTAQTASALTGWGVPAVITIPNPVLDPGIRAEGGRRRVCAAGRLVRQKGFDVLIEAFARVSEGRPGWTLTIFGEGPMRARLERQVRALRLEGRVALPGRTDRLGEELARADVFVLASRFEGFPNVLAEAMALGLPVVATRCPTGPEEMIEDGRSGRLVPVDDAGAMAAALEALIEDPALRRRLGEGAREVRARYSVGEVLGRWDVAFRMAGVRW